MYKNTIKYFGLFILSFTLLIGCSSNDDDANVAPAVIDAAYIYQVSSFQRQVEFTNASSNAETYLWDFGDGTTSTLKDPVKNYENNGDYTVILTAYNANGSSDMFQSTVVVNVNICTAEVAENTNPANGNLNFSFMSTTATTFDAFGNIGGGIVPNQVFTQGINPSCNVYRYEKIEGCETWSGTGIELATPLDFNDANASKIFKMKVMAETQVTDVTLRIEFMPFPDTEPSAERVATITQVGEWQELTFDFTGVTGTFKSMIVYFDRNAPCDGDVYYFDDLMQE